MNVVKDKNGKILVMPKARGSNINNGTYLSGGSSRVVDSKAVNNKKELANANPRQYA